MDMDGWIIGLWGETIGDRQLSHTQASNGEGVSVTLRIHVDKENFYI